MTALLRRSLLVILLALLAALSGEALAHAGAPQAPADKAFKKVARKKQVARKSARRRLARQATRRGFKRLPKRHVVKPEATAPAAIQKAAALTSPVAAGAPLTTTAEQAQYVFAGYIAAADGAPVRVWHSREYTVRSPYAYLGRMKFGAEWQHVWVETSGTLLASAVTDAPSDPLPDIAQLMERFPDGGQGVVVAGWDDFAPPAEPSVEVVEFGDTQPGATR